MWVAWWWLLIVLAIIAVVIGVYFIIRKFRRTTIDHLTTGSLTCQWAKAYGLSDTEVNKKLGNFLANELEIKHGLDNYPIAIRTSQGPRSKESRRLVHAALLKMRKQYKGAHTKTLRDNLLRLQKKVRSLWAGNDAECVSFFMGKPCDAVRLFATEKNVTREKAMEALEDIGIRRAYEAKAEALQSDLMQTNAQITALQTIALENNMADALCTGFKEPY